MQAVCRSDLHHILSCSRCTTQSARPVANFLVGTVAAVEPDAAPLRVTGRVGTGALRQPIYSSDINRTHAEAIFDVNTPPDECWHRTAGEYTVFDDTAFSFSVPALVPSKQCPCRERLADGRHTCTLVRGTPSTVTDGNAPSPGFLLFARTFRRRVRMLATWRCFVVQSP